MFTAHLTSHLNVSMRASKVSKVIRSKWSRVKRSNPSNTDVFTSHHSTQLNISPYEIIHGFKMNLGQPQIPSIDISNFPNDQQTYLQWLKHRLQDTRQAVVNQSESKETTKTAFKKRLKSEPPQWAIGEQVMLLDKRIKPGWENVLTHAIFKGPFYVTGCIQNDPANGAAYRLTDVKTAREVKSQINADGLKRYIANERRKTY